LSDGLGGHGEGHAMSNGRPTREECYDAALQVMATALVRRAIEKARAKHRDAATAAAESIQEADQRRKPERAAQLPDGRLVFDLAHYPVAREMLRRAAERHFRRIRGLAPIDGGTEDPTQ